MEGGSWPHLVEEPQNYHIGYSPHYSHEPPHQANLSPHYSLGPQHQEPFSPHQGFLLPYSSYGSPHHSYGPQYPDNVLSDLPYQHKENEWEEEEDEEDDDSLPSNTLEEALQELNIHLPRLAVTAPPSVLPPKGGGRCRLPNLGNSCYMNAVLQCLYHTPSFSACLALACEKLEEGRKQRSTVARALSVLMTKMDDVKLMKKGMMAYFKGVCGLRDEAFAGMEQQEAHEFLAGLLLWLHQDLAVREEVGCACTKNSLTRQPPTTSTTTTSNNNNVKHHSHHHLQQPPQQPQQPGTYHHQPRISNNHPNYGDQHQPSGYNYQQQPAVNDYNHYNHHHRQQNTYKYQEQQYVNQNSTSPQKSSVPDTRREGKACGRCGVTYQRRSFISDVFEGIHQLDIICAKVGIILHTAYHRFTSLSVPLNAPNEVTLEEALQQYYGMNMVMWDCDYCGKSHLCHQQLQVLCSPRILVIHISSPTKRHNARKQSVDFPIDHLTLEHHMILARKDRSRCSKYSLYAVCNHRGTMMQGHYTAFCKANKCQTQQGSWFLFDDKEISRTTHFRNTKEAHILFYKSPGVEMEP